MPRRRNDGLPKFTVTDDQEASSDRSISENDAGYRSFEYCPTCQTHGKILADRRLSRIVK